MKFSVCLWYRLISLRAMAPGRTFRFKMSFFRGLGTAIIVEGVAGAGVCELLPIFLRPALGSGDIGAAVVIDLSLILLSSDGRDGGGRPSLFFLAATLTLGIAILLVFSLVINY
jgi:hypothetical protein